ncbi:MAG: dimethylarginine dimethylaminohydrolase family protein [Pseudomonadota bacterium]
MPDGQPAAQQPPISLQRRQSGGGTAPLNDWGVDSEYGVLRDVLLAKPTHLKHMATSSLSRKFLRDAPSDIAAAQAQHAELADAYRHFGVEVHYAEGDETLPMQVYTRDSSFMTPFGAVITNMANWWRRGENYAAIRNYQRLGIPIYDMVTAGHFEGGDFDVIEPGCVLIGCGGERTQEIAARQVQGWFDAEGWETRLAFFDPFYVHIDLMVVMIAPKLAAVCLETTDPAIVDWLKGKGIRILPVPFRDTMGLGCNVMSMGGDRVIAPKHSTSLVEQLKAEGIAVAEVEIQEIMKTGGGIHCMAMPLRRDAA